MFFLFKLRFKFRNNVLLHFIQNAIFFPSSEKIPLIVRPENAPFIELRRKEGEKKTCSFFFSHFGLTGCEPERRCLWGLISVSIDRNMADTPCILVCVCTQHSCIYLHDFICVLRRRWCFIHWTGLMKRNIRPFVCVTSYGWWESKKVGVGMGH